MPIYEYECNDCQKVSEVKQKITEDPIQACPLCGGTVRRLISRTSFALKGTGYYTTDYKRAGMKPESSESKASAPAAPAPATAAPAPASTPAAAPASGAVKSS